jgi:alkanesulfonate monooxygenase SsuD/methylene tetrahydromethanopterin reductase-like flavin-dependent oxidoreductase (luciferase family)
VAGSSRVNAPLYQPALLARDLATMDAGSGGRLEIALGSGYIAADFAGFGLPFPSAGQRVEVLRKHVTTIRNLLSSPDYRALHPRHHLAFTRPRRRQLHRPRARLLHQTP